MKFQEQKMRCLRFLATAQVINFLLPTSNFFPTIKPVLFSVTEVTLNQTQRFCPFPNDTASATPEECDKTLKACTQNQECSLTQICCSDKACGGQVCKESLLRKSILADACWLNLLFWKMTLRACCSASVPKWVPIQLSLASAILRTVPSSSTILFSWCTF